MAWHFGRCFGSPNGRRLLESLLHKSLNLTTRSFRSYCTTFKNNRKFTEPNSFVGSWEVPRNPKDAEKKLAQLRRDYVKQVKVVRKEYIKEMELIRIEKQRKDDEKREAINLAKEERKKLKGEEAKLRAQERDVAQKEFRKILMKERAEKLENWKMKEKTREEKKKENNELLRKKSSLWINEKELEKKILNALVDRHDL